MLLLHQTPRAWKAPNISPFCAKLETYLRMAAIPYEIVVSAFSPPPHAPQGKVPYIELEGHVMSDSSRIISFLKQRFGDAVDGHLSVAEHDLGHLVQRTLEEGTYWALQYVRWYPDANFEVLSKKLLEPAIGLPLRWVVPDLMRRTVLSALDAQGTSRHDASWVTDCAQRDMRAVAAILGDRPYLFGDAPCSYDAVLYAFAVSIWHTPFGQDFGEPPPAIAGHLARMHERYFPELLGA